ncbi:Peroxisomal hydratase-dehydrogenase-epimerase [Escovopsis weberi]|uniref:Peroxisomal hydratase-dehydrogenase-epimerase n=1 Tax=Escovopsis weberi TaxID=150374 RepID=A0A0M8N0K9_ESCWE|nr:Peroxisomal hydratase-dehydrogenase-epimerase [Escovopsis weberi]
MADQLRYDGQVVVITGAGGGLGKQYALFFASRGASVVVNDLGGSFKGDGASAKAADLVVDEIRKAGGKAVANYDSVEFGDKIIDTAIASFGRIDILINNAGILRDVTFNKITDQDWDLITKVHITGAYKCARAAWPHFRKQKYGRVINTTSAAGLFGIFGQTNYSAAKMALVGFTETLAKEGAKYNILCNAISPVAASRMTETVMPPDVLKALGPEWIVPLVAVLTHKDNRENGAIFEAGAGHFAKVRWQRSGGLLLKPDSSYTPSAVLKNWSQVVDFSNPQYPSGPNDFLGLLEESMKMKPSEQGDKIDFKGRVVVITGAGAGIGRAYALAFAKHGATVVVNDLADPEPVVAEIKQLGGDAFGVKASAEDGDAIVKAVIAKYGRIDVLVNNAGILRDKAFNNMDDNLWHPVLNVHLRSTYKVTKAAWPYFIKQKYGRVLNTTSSSGIYGNFGQSNYAAAKAGIIGLSRVLALEGAKHNIYVNTIAPNAGTAMTATVMPPEIVEAFKPDFICPMALLLTSDKCPDPTNGLYEVGSGWCGKTRWQRAGGHGFPVNKPLVPEDLVKQWAKITDFEDGRADYPVKSSDGIEKMMANVENRAKEIVAETAPVPASEPASNEYLEAIKAALMKEGEPSEFTFTERDAVLYNLGVGAKRTDLKYVYENDEDFQVLPTFGVIPPFTADLPFDYDAIVPNFSPMLLLHGEHYLEILSDALPTSGTLTSRSHLLEVVDKGTAAVVKTGTTTSDAATRRPLFYNEMSVFIRGAGGFGGAARAQDRGAATAGNAPPRRAPDAVVAQRTGEEMAVLYRLSGDYNPLHVDPAFARAGGFREPILHGLCTFGIAGRAVLERFGRFRNIKVRFGGVVVPGQTVETEMWRDGGRVVFQCRVKETGKLAITGGAAELVQG